MNTPAWYGGPAAALAVRTTGGNVLDDRVTSVSLVNVGMGRPQPERYALTSDTDAPSMFDSCSGSIALALLNGEPLIVMNAPASLTILDAECRRHGVPTVAERIDGPLRPVIDVLVLDRAMDPHRMGARNLAALCSYYGVRHHGERDIAYDALAVAGIAQQIAHRYEPLRPLNLDQLHYAQTEWALADQDAMQARHNRSWRSGRDHRHVERGWPVCEQTALAGVERVA